MRGALALVAAFAVLAPPSFARTGTPGPDYFAGSYDLVGRSGGAPVLQNGAAVIAKRGEGVVIRQCGAPDMALGFGPSFEIVNLMTGSMGGQLLECLFHNNGYNRPILTCRSTNGAAFTLWPTGNIPLACAAP